MPTARERRLIEESMARGEGFPKLTAPSFSSFTPNQLEGVVAAGKKAGKEARDPEDGDRKRLRRSHDDDDGDHGSKRSRREGSHREGSRREDRHRKDRHRDHKEVKGKDRQDTEMVLRDTRSRSERRLSRSPRPRAEPQRTARPAQAKDVKSDHFFFDLKGDPLILKYGGIEKSKIPSYRRYGAGRVLGTAGRLFIHRETARDQFSLLMPGEGSVIFKDKDGLRSKNSRASRNPVLLRGRKASAPEVDDEDYLALESSKQTRRDAKSDSSDVETRPDYRSIEGKAKVKSGIDTDSSDESDSGDELPPLDQSNPLKWRSMQLSRRVKDQPEDIEAWLELVDHQDALLKAGQSLDHQVLENEAHSYVEIKVSMLESALSHTARPQDRLKVLNHLMREGLKIWNSKTAAKKWQEVLKDEEDDFQLWKLHLDFSMSNLASFRFDDIKAMLLSRLMRVLSTPESDASKSYAQASYIFLRTTKFIHDAGYKELAVAAWQAMIELTFFRPAGLDGKDAALGAFEEFWESEVPRIGEDGALGWKEFVNSPGDAPEPVKHSPAQAEHPKDLYKAWANEERRQADRARCPARTLDEGNDDDPFRVVMYSDVAPLLFYVPDNILPRVGRQLLNGFLIFFGLTSLSSTDDWTALALEDPFLNEGRINLSNEAGKNKAADQETTKPMPDFAPASLHATLTPELLFSGDSWYQCFPGVNHLQLQTLDLVQNTTKQLVSNIALQEDLALYHLALGTLRTPANLKKLAKSLLKQFPTSLALYHGYALAENAQTHVDVARKVLASATELASNSTSSHKSLLWKAWAWIELDSGARNLAIKRLCSGFDDVLRKTPDDNETVVSAAYLIKAQRDLTSSFQQLASTGDVEGAGIQAECMALLAYLTADGCTEPTSLSQGNISAAMERVNISRKELQSRGFEGSTAIEKLIQFAARLLYLNATKGPYRRAYLREKLTAWLGDFPRNTILLSLLEWSDSGLRVVDETRTLLYDRVLVKPHDCVSSRIFAVEHELSHGNPNSTKAAFEQALTSEACKNNIYVWIAYIQFCYEDRNLRSKAKDTFYRALRHCPWSKDIMMEAFGPLIRNMESEELKSIYAMMTSKGLRVHVDMDEFMKSSRATKSGDRQKGR